MTTIFYGILVPLLLVAAFMDVRSRRIPNWLTLPAAAVAMVYRFGAEGAWGLMGGIEGLMLGMACLLPFYIAGGMGAGDVKLMGALGALLGPKEVFMAFLFSAMAGGVYALGLLAVRARSKEAMLHYGTMLGFFYCTGAMPCMRPAAGEQPVLRYAVAIAAGTLLARVGGLL